MRVLHGERTYKDGQDVWDTYMDDLEKLAVTLSARVAELKADKTEKDWGDHHTNSYDLGKARYSLVQALEELGAIEQGTSHAYNHSRNEQFVGILAVED